MAVRKASSGIWFVEFQMAGVRVHRSARTRDRRAAQALERRLREEVHRTRVLGQPVLVPRTLGWAVRRYVEEHLVPNTKRAQNLKNDRYLLDRLVGLLGGPEQELHRISSARVADLVVFNETLHEVA